MKPGPKSKKASRQARGYDDDWYRLRDAHLAKDKVCVRCGEEADQVDHKIPFDGVSDPRRLDPGNLQSLCISCHAKKTAEDHGRGGAKKERLPPDPNTTFGRIYAATEKMRTRYAKRQTAKADQVAHS